MKLRQGVYGMNFDTTSRWNMPELGWEYGYLYWWMVALFIEAVITYFFLRLGLYEGFWQRIGYTKPPLARLESIKVNT